jgi:hypothetical protein
MQVLQNNINLRMGLKITLDQQSQCGRCDSMSADGLEVDMAAPKGGAEGCVACLDAVHADVRDDYERPLLCCQSRLMGPCSNPWGCTA